MARALPRHGLGCGGSRPISSRLIVPRVTHDASGVGAASPALHQSVPDTPRRNSSRVASSCANIVARTLCAVASAGQRSCRPSERAIPTSCSPTSAGRTHAEAGCAVRAACVRRARDTANRRDTMRGAHRNPAGSRQRCAWHTTPARRVPAGCSSDRPRGATPRPHLRSQTCWPCTQRQREGPRCRRANSS